VRAHTMGYDDMVDTGKPRVLGKWLLLYRTRGDQALVHWYMGWIRVSVGLSGYGHKKEDIISIYSFIQEKTFSFSYFLSSVSFFLLLRSLVCYG